VFGVASMVLRNDKAGGGRAGQAHTGGAKKIASGHRAHRVSP
jgi:hypothetical protein